MKDCIGCSCTKPLSDFPKRKDAKDGCRNTCNTCTNSDWKEYKQGNRESYLENARRYTRTEKGRELRKSWRLSAKGREINREYQERYRLESPEKHKAHYLLAYAVKTGKVTKSENCNKCGSSDHIHGHHEDYSKPLEVEWICAICHVALHKELA